MIEGIFLPFCVEMNIPHMFPKILIVKNGTMQ